MMRTRCFFESIRGLKMATSTDTGRDPSNSHPQVADLYEMAANDRNEGPGLVWRQKPEQQQWLEAREGAYLLRTNLTVNGAAYLWRKYTQLTEVEAAFCALKSELAIRPLFHQLEKGVKAYVLASNPTVNTSALSILTQRASR
jgi:hypothetical protein